MNDFCAGLNRLLFILLLYHGYRFRSTAVNASWRVERGNTALYLRFRVGTRPDPLSGHLGHCD